jgi:hypothetical protein
MNSMTRLSYKIHLPNGIVIDAKNSHNLEIILSLNVCRVYQPSQIHIEPIYPRHNPGEALGVRRDSIQHKQKDFVSSLRRHERDCPCGDCEAL